MKLKQEEIEKRLNEIPKNIDKLNTEYHQLFGYLQCLKDIKNDKKVEKKK